MLTGGFARWVSAVGAGVALVGAQLGVQVLTAAPAAAAVQGLRVVSELSDYDSSSTKTVWADCDDDEVVLGGGGGIVGGAGNVTLHWLEPYDFGAYVAGASEVPAGYSGPWQVQAYAICATAPVPGYEIVSEQVGKGLSSFRGITVTCPGGKKVIGTGGTLFGGYGRVTYHSLAPNSEGTRVTVLGVVDGAFENQAEFGVRAIAVCASPPPDWGWQKVSYSSPVIDAAGYAVQKSCPGNKRVTGLGLSRTVVAGHAFVDGMYPSSTGRSGVVVGHQRAPRVDWDIAVTAICAN
jgi:hypothetical protein